MVGLSNSVQPECLPSAVPQFTTTPLAVTHPMGDTEQAHCSTTDPRKASKRRSGVEGMGFLPARGVPQDPMGSHMTQSSYNSCATEDTQPCTARSCWQEHKPRKRQHKSSKSNTSEVVTFDAESGEDKAGTKKEDIKTRSRSTITRGLLSTSGFVWVPLCRPSVTSRNSSVGIPDEVLACSRLYMRRNALADPMQMALPQDTRERIQKEVEDRKSSFTRKVSQYFRAMYTDDYEVDLI